MKCLISLMIGWTLVASASAAKLPSGFILADESLSTNRVYGVLVPDGGHFNGKPDQNSIVEVKTGRILGPIYGETGQSSGNPGGSSAKWSADSSILVWTVEGKWGPLEIMVVELKGGKITRQSELLKPIRNELLAALKKERPVEYASAREANRGNGSAYPGGFTVDVHCSRPDAKRRITFAAGLTSDLKEALAPDEQLEAYGEGEFIPGQSIVFHTFKALGPVQIGTEKKRLERAVNECQQVYQQLLQELSGPGRDKLEKDQAAWEIRLLKVTATFSFVDASARVLRTAAYQKRSAELMRRLK